MINSILLRHLTNNDFRVLLIYDSKDVVEECWIVQVFEQDTADVRYCRVEGFEMTTYLTQIPQALTEIETIKGVNDYIDNNRLHKSAMKFSINTRYKLYETPKKSY